jgi:DNA invertase Pin-like site-specific DNA recombinase
MIPCVIYGVKSSPDDKDSISTQVAACRDAINREGGRSRIAEPFTEANASGSKANRGPQLAAAIAAASASAPSELWVWHTSRLGRGSGRAGEARALGALLYELRAAGVTVRSAEDDDFATNEMLWGFASKMASKYSEDLQTWVRGGKARQREMGRYLGGPVPDGYRQDRLPDGKPHGPRVIDREREPIIRRAFELATTLGDKEAAAHLNDDGHRRKSGKRWDRRSVQAMVTNPHYAGHLKNLDGKPVPAIVTPHEFEAIQASRAARDRAAAGRRRAQDGMPKGGRPTTRYVLAKLGTCARCDGTMYARTSPHTRKDGTRQRSYVCANSAAYDKTTATCDAPKIDAQTADAAIVPHLRGFFVDFQGWLGRVTDAQEADRDGLRRQVAEATTRIAKLAAAHEKAHDRYVAALAEADTPPTRIAALEAALEKMTADRAHTQASHDDLAAALAEVETDEAPVDAMLDWWNALSASIRGALDSTESVAEVNARLRDVLAEVQMDTMPDGRIKLLAVFADRGELVPKVDANDDPLCDEEPDFYPDQVDVYARSGLTFTPPARSIETGPDSHE